MKLLYVDGVAGIPNRFFFLCGFAVAFVISALPLSVRAKPSELNMNTVLACSHEVCGARQLVLEPNVLEAVPFESDLRGTRGDSLPSTNTLWSKLPDGPVGGAVIGGVPKVLPGPFNAASQLLVANAGNENLKILAASSSQPSPAPLSKEEADQLALETWSGYKAQIICIGAFISGRDPNKVAQDDTTFTEVLKNAKYEVHNGVISSPIGNGRNLYAVYRGPERGCTLYVGKDASSIPLDEVSMDHSGWKEQHLQTDPHSCVQQVLDGYFAISEDGSTKSLDGSRAISVMTDENTILAGRYAEGFNPTMPLMGWSMTKTWLGVLAGIKQDEDRLKKNGFSLDSNLGTLLKINKTDPRSQITVRQLLQMSSCLDFNEDYVPGKAVPEMLFRTGANDMAEFVKKTPIKENCTLGKDYFYATQSSVLLSGILKQQLGKKYATYPWTKLFDPAGIRASVGQDPTGTDVGGSYMVASPIDWMLFGELIRYQGRVGGVQVVPRDWLAASVVPSEATANHEAERYGFHIRMRFAKVGNETVPYYMARGFAGQRLLIVPPKDSVTKGFTAVRLAHQLGKDWDVDKFVGDVVGAMQHGAQDCMPSGKDIVR